MSGDPIQTLRDALMLHARTDDICYWCSSSQGAPHDEECALVALAAVTELAEAARDLAHNTRRMLQALDAYWMWCDGWQGPSNRYPRSQSTAEDWWHRFEKYRARVEAGRAALVLFPPANKEQP